MNQEEQQLENKQENDSSKDAKKFDAAMKRIVAILGGDTLLKATKIEGSDLSVLVERISKTEKEKLLNEFEAGAISLIERKRAFDRFEREERKKFEKLILDKKKEFVTEAEKLFKLVDKIEGIEREYYETLRSAATGDDIPTAPTDPQPSL